MTRVETPYRYFVSYAFGAGGRGGFGYSEVGTSTPVTTFAHVDQFRTTLAAAPNSMLRADEIAILHFVLLSGPDGDAR